MILTEAEAKTKWCPFARAWEGGDNSGEAAATNRQCSDGNNPGGARSYTRCIASDCMAWRWFGAKSDTKRTGCCGLTGHEP